MAADRDNHAAAPTGAPRRVELRGDDFGLGLCLGCLTDRMAGGPGTNGLGPRYAITSAPMTVPVPDPVGGLARVAIVVVPTCGEHLNAAPAPSRLARG